MKIKMPNKSRQATDVISQYESKQTFASVPHYLSTLNVVGIAIGTIALYFSFSWTVEYAQAFFSGNKGVVK